jgi:hypothetical protein
MPHHDTAFCRRVRAARWGVHLAFRRHSIYLQLNVGQQNGSVASAFRFDRGPSVWLVSPLMEAGQPYAWMQLYTERTWRGDCGVALARAANQLNLPRTPAGFGVIAPCIAASEHVMLITHVVLYIQKASERDMYKRWSLFTLWAFDDHAPALVPPCCTTSRLQSHFWFDDQTHQHREHPAVLTGKV